jgi:hypothetical protein
MKFRTKEIRMVILLSRNSVSFLMVKLTQSKQTTWPNRQVGKFGSSRVKIVFSSCMSDQVRPRGDVNIFGLTNFHFLVAKLWYTKDWVLLELIGAELRYQYHCVIIYTNNTYRTHFSAF